MGHYVYKYVYNNEIIYIGKNDTDLYSRLNPEDQHYLMELANMILSIGEKKKNDKKWFDEV